MSGPKVTGIFGGNTSLSHYTVSVPYLSEEEKKLRAAGGHVREYSKMQRERRAAAWHSLREAGFQEKYFQWTNGNEAEKAKAYKAAMDYKKVWEKKAKTTLTVNEGCFL